MKKTIIAIISVTAVISLPLLAQVTTPLPLREGQGGGSIGGGSPLTLQQLKDSALQHNVAIRTARLDVAAAQQQRREAFTNYFPSVSATGLTFNANRGMAKMEIDPSEIIPPSMATMLSQMLPAEALAALGSPMGMTMMKNGTLAGITATQPLFAGGQIVNGNRLARVGEEVSRLQLQLSEQEVEETTEQYYWQLVSLLQKQHTLDAVDSLLADIHKDVSIAVQAGVAMNNDLLQVELRQNDIASQRLKLDNGISLLKMLLGQYCGLRSFSLPTFDIAQPDMSQQNLLLSSSSQERLRVHAEASEQVRADEPCPGMGSVVRLPEYQLLEKQVEAARLQRRMTVGQNLPTVAVGAGYNYHNLMENERTFGMIFATVSVPLSGWWGGSHAIKRRTIELQKAQEQLTDNSELLEIRMQKSWNDVVEASQQLQIAGRSIEQATENLRLNRDYYRAGTATMNSLLEAELLLQQALDRRTEAYADYQLRLLAYRHASGQ